MVHSLRRGLAVVLFSVALLVGSPVQGDAKSVRDWAPAKTWVFAVGILEWQDPDTWAPFPEIVEGRCDQQLVEFFKKSGVPKEQIVYLQDKQATLQRIQKKFKEFITQLGEDDLLVFYFAGHGWWDSDNNLYYFANYDAHKADASDMWSIRSICTTMQKHFAGGRVLFLADCCHSGGLLFETGKRGWTIPSACFTSTYAHNLSTGSWTFSEALLKGLRGNAQLDLDDNGTITLDELARFTALEMAFIEEQKSVLATANGFSARMRLAPAKGKRDERIGRHVEAQYTDGKWYKAIVTRITDEGTTVRYCESDEDEVIAEDARIRPFRPKMRSKGSRVKVLWSDGEKYDAIIKEAWYGIYFVTYPDYGDDYDEWISADQLKN